MELPDDILGRLVAFAPWEFLGVSKGLNAAANAALDSRKILRTRGIYNQILIDDIMIEWNDDLYSLTTPRANIDFRRSHNDKWSACKILDGKIVFRIIVWQDSRSWCCIIPPREQRLFEKLQTMVSFLPGVKINT